MKREILIVGALFGLVIGYVIASEVCYLRSISPKGISTARGYLTRFGEPKRIRLLQRDGQRFYEFTGHWPSGWVLATPSAPPAYIFDEHGRFVGWCRDPGDMPSYRRSWPLASTDPVEIGLVMEKLGSP